MPTIKELLESEDGMPIVPSVSARVKYADAIVSGEKDGRSWAFMPMKLTDSTGDIIRCLWWSPDAGVQPKDMVGKEISFRASRNAKGVLAGATVKHRERRNGDGIDVEVHVNGENLAFGSGVSSETDRAPASRPPWEGKESTSASPTMRPAPTGVLSDVEVLAAIERWVEHLGIMFPESTALAACVNTLVIAATQGRIRIETPQATVAKMAARSQENAERASEEAFWNSLEGSEPVR